MGEVRSISLENAIKGYFVPKGQRTENIFGWNNTKSACRQAV